MEGQMAKQVNAAGVSNANARIAAGDVVDQPWSFSAADGNAMLGANGDDWAEYGRWHLRQIQLNRKKRRRITCINSHLF
jgi:hypothetical protein